MNSTKVIIKNWPKDNHIEKRITIAIAIIALLVSLYSVLLTRQTFITSQRPYVWAGNYGVVDVDNKSIIPIPFRVAGRVKNSPARILRMEIRINLDGEKLFVNTKENFVKFPDEASEWSFTIGKESFDKIILRSDEDKSRLVRIISLEYSSLNGGKIYRYKLEQHFNPSENQWEDDTEEAS